MGCLRLFRAIFEGYFGGVLEGFKKVLEGKTYYFLTYKKLIKNLFNTLKYYLKLDINTGYWKATGQNFGNRFNCNQFTSKLVNMEILAC